MSSNRYHIDFVKMALWWLPTFLRRTRLASWAVVPVLPVRRLYFLFLQKRRQHNERLDTNYQKWSLQKRLNDLYDPIERRIKIVSAITYQGIYLYTEAEDDVSFSKTKWLSDQPLFLRTAEELGGSVDFIVQIPNVGIDQSLLRATINYHALRGKRYTVELV